MNIKLPTGLRVVSKGIAFLKGAHRTKSLVTNFWTFFIVVVNVLATDQTNIQYREVTFSTQ
jgi:hypothetical protein